ncbi:hypothetical protein WAX74_01885 [Psychrobacillus sp. FJAT-51614]|uniref:Uncharacterized protein n=1 Tax=Psychrobacillus mangrovi TaxID=3117745 RepID=A0ABU8F070_9BACI
MDINEIMKKINESMDKMDLVTARRSIEHNLDLINENRHLLRRNARSLFKILQNTEIEKIRGIGE